MKYITKASSLYSYIEYSPKDPKQKTGSLPEKQNKKLSQNIDKFNKNITAAEFKIISD